MNIPYTLPQAGRMKAHLLYLLMLGGVIMCPVAAESPDTPVLKVGDPAPALAVEPGGEVADKAGEQKLTRIFQAERPIEETLAALEVLGKEHPKVLPKIQRIRFHILYDELNDHDKAYEVAAQMLETHKDQPDVLGSIAWTIMEPNEMDSSNPPLALQLAEQAVKASGGGDLEFLDLLACAHFEVGRAKAVEVMRKAVALATENAKFDQDSEGDLGYAQEILNNYTGFDPHKQHDGAPEENREVKEKVLTEEPPKIKVGVLQMPSSHQRP